MRNSTYAHRACRQYYLPPTSVLIYFIMLTHAKTMAYIIRIDCVAIIALNSFFCFLENFFLSRDLVRIVRGVVSRLRGGGGCTVSDLWFKTSTSQSMHGVSMATMTIWLDPSAPPLLLVPLYTSCLHYRSVSDTNLYPHPEPCPINHPLPDRVKLLDEFSVLSIHRHTAIFTTLQHGHNKAIYYCT